MFLSDSYKYMSHGCWSPKNMNIYIVNKLRGKKVYIYEIKPRFFFSFREKWYPSLWVHTARRLKYIYYENVKFFLTKLINIIKHFQSAHLTLLCCFNTKILHPKMSGVLIIHVLSQVHLYRVRFMFYTPVKNL